MYPFLSLSTVSIDPELGRRLPRQLAYYHLAIPIADDDDSITVAMALTNNPQVIGLLEAVLNASVIPVRSHADEIKAALDTIWQRADNIDQPKLLAWSDSIEKSAWINSYAETFAQAFATEATYLDVERSSLDTALQIATSGHYNLIVTGETENLETLLARSPAPLLLVRSQPRPFRHMLFALRGHAPDRAALEYVIPLLRQHHSRVTLLSISPPSSAGQVRLSGIAELLSKESIPGKHLAACTEILTAAKIAGSLKLRQGRPEQEIAAEIASSDYDLVVIAAETYGDFVHQTLKALPPDNTSPILVLKYQAARTPQH
jgi:nucleotide-binding universal stress UspA family protein